MGSGKAQTTVDGPTSNGICFRYMRASDSELLETIGESVWSSRSSVASGSDSWELLLELDDGSDIGDCRTLRDPSLTHSPRQNGSKPDQQALPGFNALRGDSGRMSRLRVAEDFNEVVKSEQWIAILWFRDTVEFMGLAQ